MMDYYNPMEEDQEELDVLSGQPLMPNTPRDPGDPREKLRSYLAQKAESERKMASPDYRAALREPQNILQDSNSDLGYSKLLMAAANQIGTLGGKAASSAPYDQFATGLQNQNSQVMAGIDKERAMADQRDLQRQKTMEYLANKFDQDERFKQGLEYKKERDKKTDEYRQAMITANKGAKADRDADKKEQAEEKDVQKLSTALQGSQDIVTAVKDVENLLGGKLDDFTVNKDKLSREGKEVDLPGVSVPLLGRVSAYDSEARDLKGAIGKVFNTVLKDRSGSAVSNSEMDRLRDEFNSGKFNSEAEMIGALQRYKAALHQALVNREAGFRPEVVETYSGRGGVTSSAIKAGKSAPSSGGRKPIEEMTPEEIDAEFDEHKKAGRL